jgi:hypothetical protein
MIILAAKEKLRGSLIGAEVEAVLLYRQQI